jgi:hypothetical protein
MGGLQDRIGIKGFTVQDNGSLISINKQRSFPGFGGFFYGLGLPGFQRIWKLSMDRDIAFLRIWIARLQWIWIFRSCLYKGVKRIMC